MSYKVLGIGVVDYENKEGRNIRGLKLHLSYEDENIDGQGVFTVFVSERIECNAQVGDTVRVVYNRFGCVAGIDVLA